MHLSVEYPANYLHSAGHRGYYSVLPPARLPYGRTQTAGQALGL